MLREEWGAQDKNPVLQWLARQNKQVSGIGRRIAQRVRYKLRPLHHKPGLSQQGQIRCPVVVAPVHAHAEVVVVDVVVDVGRAQAQEGKAARLQRPVERGQNAGVLVARDVDDGVVGACLLYTSSSGEA